MALQRDSLKADSIARKTGQLPGAILPGHRIVAFYGNIRSKGMGILGREPKDQMMRNDPEFAMLTKKVRPGKKIGTYDAQDINYAINFLARIVSENHLPPKMLMVHRFTQGMVTNYKSIKLDPRVQVVMDMDGWGDPTLKKHSYEAYIEKEPVQYTGFKLFYEYDPKPKPHHMMTPTEVLTTLNPKPLYIQYQ
ncbi:MAG: hypothetical protein EOO56_20110 [Hymenobacter sp.]|nr:MAG: hypothetical protein EOO56_20110 [Hymenobacter sp.]